eukprot:563727-Pyramimonas_sp.AAC.2
MDTEDVADKDDNPAYPGGSYTTAVTTPVQTKSPNLSQRFMPMRSGGTKHLLWNTGMEEILPAPPNPYPE